MKHIALTLAALAAAMPLTAEVLEVGTFDYCGPWAVATPLMVDGVDVQGKAYDAQALPPSPAYLALPEPSRRGATLVQAPGYHVPAVHVISFAIDNTSYATPKLEVEGLDVYDIYLDGAKADSPDLTLKPGTHTVSLRYLSNPGASKDLKVKLDSPTDAGMKLRTDGKRNYSMDDVLHGPRVTRAAVSPDGKFAIATYADTRRGGSVSRTDRVTYLSGNTTVGESDERLAWMPTGSSYYWTRPGMDGMEIVIADASTGARRVVKTNLEEGTPFRWTPDGTKLVVTRYSEGRTENPGVYEILEPEDRQPGWRSRSSLALYDPATGMLTPLTFGNRNVSLLDISPDSRRILLSTSNSRLSQRPTTVFSIYQLDLNTMKTDTLVTDDGFVGSAVYSPDGRRVLLSGSPESLGGVGLNVPEGRTPSMVDTQLYIMDLATRKVTPLTKGFNPSVTGFAWSRADDMIYLMAEDRDRVNLFRLNPATGASERLNAPEELVKGFSLPDTGRGMVLWGESVASPNALYTFDTRSQRAVLLDRPQAQSIAGVKLGETGAWDFVNERGDTICGRYYLPVDFDPNKKYPLIVNYYGGCSPTSRNFESRYPHHAYAAQGYVVYVVEPSGATGFGQEFSSRHGNTAGQGVADDIIEGTKRFCGEHPFVDDKKIGCIGASYGGFMTQYLQTVTDIFAAAVSHAGISDHTSYWGEGYWGYSYSEVSMPGSYPWTRKDLYVDCSPLYNADKIHTPMLFLHGDADVNVPVGESIQMFTALKLLGRPTAFVAVADQDHHILDYDKRIRWQDTIFAWFARHLKDDPSWWDALYPATPL